MMRPCAAATLRLGTAACSRCACSRFGRKMCAPLRLSSGRVVSSSDATGLSAGDVAMPSIVLALPKLLKTSLSNAESTDDRLAETAAGLVKSTGVGASLPHAAKAARPITTPARRGNRIQPPQDEMGKKLNSAGTQAAQAVTLGTSIPANRSLHRRVGDRWR